MATEYTGQFPLSPCPDPQCGGAGRALHVGSRAVAFCDTCGLRTHEYHVSAKTPSNRVITAMKRAVNQWERIQR